MIKPGIKGRWALHKLRQTSPPFREFEKQIAKVANREYRGGQCTYSHDRIAGTLVPTELMPVEEGGSNVFLMRRGLFNGPLRFVSVHKPPLGAGDWIPRPLSSHFPWGQREYVKISIGSGAFTGGPVVTMHESDPLRDGLFGYPHTWGIRDGKLVKWG